MQYRDSCRLAGWSILALVYACGGGDKPIGPETSGTLEVSTATTGVEIDPDGYTLQLDGADIGAIGLAATIQHTDVPPGNHTVQLRDLIFNCEVTGYNPRSLSITAGETTRLSFEVGCYATSGRLEIRTITTGAIPDPDGYAVALDDGLPRTIGVNGSLTLPAVITGAHRLTLSGLAANCSVQGANPRPVTVTVNGFATVEFAISCGGSSWLSMESGSTRLLKSVSGISAAGVFAAGEKDECDDQGCGLAMSILHYDGRTWSTEFTHPGSVQDLWAAPNGEAFVLANGRFSEPMLLHYDGQQWSPAVQPVAREGELPTMNALWGSSATDVFGVGMIQFWRGNPRAYIAHFDGTEWSRMETTNDEYVQLAAVWGSSARDVYAVGSYQAVYYDPSRSGAVILHYDGHAWSEALRELHQFLYHVWGTSASDVYATGVVVGSHEETIGGAIWHFDGRGWSALPSPTNEALGPIWGSSSSDVYVLAGEHSIWHFDKTMWKEVLNSSLSFRDIWGASAADIFAVGADGSILHGP